MQTLLYFLLWAGAIFLMMRFGCGAHVMGHRHRHDTGQSSQPPEKAVDPVCGMTVETATAKSSFFGGRAYFFCSQDCRDKFEASPASHAKGAAGRMETMEERHAAHH
jgi:YHS domain-containing protein